MQFGRNGARSPPFCRFEAALRSPGRLQLPTQLSRHSASHALRRCTLLGDLQWTLMCLAQAFGKCKFPTGSDRPHLSTHCGTHQSPSQCPAGHCSCLSPVTSHECVHGTRALRRVPRARGQLNTHRQLQLLRPILLQVGSASCSFQQANKSQWRTRGQAAGPDAYTTFL